MRTTPATGAITGPVAYYWQVERMPGHGHLRRHPGRERRQARDGARRDLPGDRGPRRAVDPRQGRLSGRQRRAGAGVLSRDRAGHRRGHRRPRRCQICRTEAMSPAPACISFSPTSNSFSIRSRSRNGMRPARICSTFSRTHGWLSACARSMDRSTTWSTGQRRVRRGGRVVPAADRPGVPQRPGRRSFDANGPAPDG